MQVTPELVATAYENTGLNPRGGMFLKPADDKEPESACAAGALYIFMTGDRDIDKVDDVGTFARRVQVFFDSNFGYSPTAFGLGFDFGFKHGKKMEDPEVFDLPRREGNKVGLAIREGLETRTMVTA